MMERMLTHCDVSATVAILTAKIDGSRQQTAAVFAEECAGHESSANLDSPNKFARQKKITALYRLVESPKLINQPEVAAQKDGQTHEPMIFACHWGIIVTTSW
jgi:hypothetical protein